MGKKRIPIDESILGLDTPWDDGTNAYTGARVEEFIKAQLGSKAGAHLIEGDTLRIFRSTADRAAYVSDTTRTDLILESLSLGSVIVDESFNEESHNPIANNVVAARIKALEEATVGNVVITESGGVNTLQIKNKTGETIAEAEFVAGGGQGGDSTTSYMTLRASIDKELVKEGDGATLTWSYAHTTSDGVPDGRRANVFITIKIGAVTTYEETIYNVGAGQYTMDLKPYMRAGRVEVHLLGVCDLGDRIQRGTAYADINVATLNLETTFDISACLSTGGYGSSDTIEIPWTIVGPGDKEVKMYLDGSARDSESVTKGSKTGSFVIPGSALSAPGRHTVQLVAERAGLKSSSIHLDILKAGGNAAYVGMKVIDTSGTIRTGQSHLTPMITTKQYEQYVVQYVAYDPARSVANVTLRLDGNVVSTVQVPRTMQTWADRMTSSGEHTLQVACGSASVLASMDVEASDIDVAEVDGGLVAKLDAKGRSNSESNPAVWADGDVSTTFEGVDWATSGWQDGALLLMNGAKATIGYQPFADNSAKQRGMTLEMTLTVRNINDRSASIIHCIDGGKGLRITGTEIGYLTGATVEYTNEDEELVRRDVKMTTNYVPDRRIKVALVVESERNVMTLYVNGNRVAAETYSNEFNFRQDAPQYITIDSTEADVALEMVRVYNRALSDDEEIDNWIVDLPTAEEMSIEVKDNDILTEDGQKVDMAKLLAKGKGVLRIIRANKLDDVYATNDKKADFLADIEFCSPFGREYDFKLYNVNIRIQGTSSTKYPSKNIRIYFNKSKEGTPELWINGVKQERPNMYAMRPGAQPMNLYTMKSDSVDSSMSLNTGGAKLFNDMMIRMGLLTPPQRAQVEAHQDVTVRTAIDGFPVDIFVSATVDSEAEYVGQYNFNNEKSDSEALFGQADYPNAIALEMLNNTNRICLFSTTSDEDLAEQFDLGAEFNYPAKTNGSDTKWANCAQNHRTAIQNLYTWIRDCVPSGATSSNINSYRSTKFVNEVNDHFDLDFILTYYLFTDYFLSVDQRAKNMMLRTWDGLKWYITYYDGDTSMGKRNDGYQVYDYTTDRDTYDGEKSKYAYEGHDSALWNLCLANFGTRLSQLAVQMRQVLTKEWVKEVLIEEQSGNWSVRASNKSGEVKYITPAIVPTYGHIWPFIFMLQGLNIEQRRYFIDNRFALLDAKYGTGEYRNDAIELYMARTSSQAADTVSIRSMEPYAFGYARKNGDMIATTGIVGQGEIASLAIDIDLTVNDPISICGASRVTELDMSRAAKHLKNTLDLSKCVNMRRLVLDSGDNTGSTAWNLSLSGCKALRHLSARNQKQLTTSTSSAHVMDLSEQTKLEYLDVRGTDLESLTIADGAPLSELHLPTTLQTLRLRYLHQLTSQDVELSSYASVRTLEVSGCEGIDSLQMVRNWVSQKSTDDSLCELVLRGIEWTGVSVTELLRLCTINELTIEGTIALAQKPTVAEVRALVAAFGSEAFGGNGTLTITAPTPNYSDNFIVCAPERVTEGDSVDAPIVVLGAGVTDVTVTVNASEGISATYDPTTMVVHITSEERGTVGMVSITIQGKKGGVDVEGYGSIEVQQKTYPTDFVITASSMMSPGQTAVVTLRAMDTQQSDGEWRVVWNIVGSQYTDKVLIGSQESFGCTLRLLDSAPIGTFSLRAQILKVRDSSLVTEVTKVITVRPEGWLMDATSNQAVYNICRSKGWCAGGYMTMDEAAAVTNLGTAFKDNTQIVTFDEFEYFTGITQLNNEEFRGCSNLRSITIPQSVTEMTSNPFVGTSQMERISGKFTVGNVAVVIGTTLVTAAYKYVTDHGYDSKVLPTGITTIGKSAFENMLWLESVCVLPEGMRVVDEKAFYYAYLKSISFPSTIQAIKSGALSYNSKMNFIYINTVTPPSYEGSTDVGGSVRGEKILYVPAATPNGVYEASQCNQLITAGYVLSKTL